MKCCNYPTLGTLRVGLPPDAPMTKTMLTCYGHNRVKIIIKIYRIRCEKAENEIRGFEEGITAVFDIPMVTLPDPLMWGLSMTKTINKA